MFAIGVCTLRFLHCRYLCECAQLSGDGNLFKAHVIVHPGTDCSSPRGKLFAAVVCTFLV